MLENIFITPNQWNRPWPPSRVVKVRDMPHDDRLSNIGGYSQSPRKPPWYFLLFEFSNSARLDSVDEPLVVVEAKGVRGPGTLDVDGKLRTVFSKLELEYKVGVSVVRQRSSVAIDLIAFPE